MDFNQHAYNLEYFNFTAEQILAERNHLVQCLISKAIDTAIKKIETPATSTQLAQQKAQVLHSIQESTNKRLAQVNALDKATFHVPKHVLQMQDLYLEHKFSPQDEQKKQAQLDELKTQYRQNLAMLAQLKNDQQKIADLEPILNKEQEMQKQIIEKQYSFNYQNLNKFYQRVINNQQLHDKKEVDK